MYKHLIACLIFCAAAFAGTAQCPPNLDFETGTLDHWQCMTGAVTSDTENHITLHNSAPAIGRHEIISASSAVQKDPYGNFPTLCPYGGNYSVKLGNEMVGAEAEGISYTFSIPPNVDTMTFTYFYAVVFEDPQHETWEQPRFFVTAYDVETKEVINCASYDYVSTSSLPGFQKSAINQNVLYKNWSPVSLQFFGLNGRDVRLEFRTADCSLSGHFGYAYLDVGTGCSNILATAPYCPETNSLILNAPYGFKDYTWYNEDYSQVVGTGQSITFSPAPVTTGSYFVDMVPYPGFGCRDTASATVHPMETPEVPIADSIFYCQFDVPFEVQAKALPGHDILWYMDTTALPFDFPPIPSTNTVDTFEYFVSQKKLFGCESFRVKQVAIVRPTPTAAFNIDVLRQCENGNNFTFTSTASNLSNAKYIWDFGDGHLDSSAANGIIKHHYDQFGNYNVRFTVNNQPSCSAEAFNNITVVPKPLADIAIPPVICDGDMNVQIADRSYVPYSLGTVNKWWWNVNGTEYTTQPVPAFNVVHPGHIPVKLTVASQEGCVSDTLTKMINIWHKPAAAFDYKTVLCENEAVKFSDLSNIPDGTSQEYVANWSWTFDASVSSTAHEPVSQFVAGVHKARLTATSNFGCVSEAIEKAFVVNPKPWIGLNINDSCVDKKIFYEAQDLRHNVNAWYWDFGNGLKKGESTVMRKFRWESDQSFVLIGQTDMGCKDTINRPFKIYSNHSYAGRDTIVAKNQPVYLDAKGGPDVTYSWSPSIGLSDPSSEKPVATLDRDQQYTLYSITAEGCERTSNIFIKRYVGAELYIPNAFTPNGDGHNDELKVFPVGIKSFTFFAVYNRYGQQVFYTNDYSKGWDGTINGAKQDSGNYVAVVRAVDYNGNLMQRRENVVLLR
jgi:gliding motility-associated-like protein